MTDFFTDTNGHLWWVDVDKITHMLRMWAQAKANIDAMSVRPARDQDFNELKFDQPKFRHHRERYHQEEIARVSQHIYTNPDNVVNQLLRRHREIPRLEEELRIIYRQVRSHNSDVINQRVDWGETGLASATIARDLSSAIFMCCISISGLGISAAMLARLGGSVFQATSTYQDTGNVGAALATGVLSFKSSLMALPASASRAAQIIFTIVNTGNTTVANSAIRMATVSPESTQTFTSILRQELITAGLGASTDGALSRINNQLSGQVLPVLLTITRDRGSGALSAQISNSFQAGNNHRPTPGGRMRTQQGVNSRTAGMSEEIWESTPFYQFHATGDPNVLLSPTELEIRGTMLRRGE